MFHFFLGYVFCLITDGFYYMLVYYPELCVMLYRKGVYTKQQALEHSKVSKERFEKLLNK